MNAQQELHYLRAISYASRASHESHQISCNLLITLCIRATNFLPSVVATACRKIIARIYEENYVNHFGINEDAVDACAYDTCLPEVTKVFS